MAPASSPLSFSSLPPVPLLSPTYVEASQQRRPRKKLVPRNIKQGRGRDCYSGPINWLSVSFLFFLRLSLPHYGPSWHQLLPTPVPVPNFLQSSLTIKQFHACFSDLKNPSVCSPFPVGYSLKPIAWPYQIFLSQNQSYCRPEMVD